MYIVQPMEMDKRHAYNYAVKVHIYSSALCTASFLDSGVGETQLGIAGPSD